jgi:integrase/recombinase XerD
MEHYIKSFERWLNLLNYSKSTIYNDPKYIKRFTDYLKTSGVKNIQDTENRHIKDYYNYLKVRPNIRKSGALSQNSIISNINALKRFAKYLRETEQTHINININPERINPEKIILTPAEIQALYKACENNTLGIRDRAMLSIYYGLGLRRAEGIRLNIEDIHINKSTVFIKKSKTGRQRYVPMNKQVKNDIENYINYARIRLIRNTNEKALFLTYRGKRISGNGMIRRLKHLTEKAEINKPVGLHTLRHSIATHLLRSGMTLENVSKFLGHHSLESTQIYTHIKNNQL